MAPSFSEGHDEHHPGHLDLRNQPNCNGYHEDTGAVVSYDKSPYQDTSIVSILVGKDETPFMIHSTVITQSEVLAAKVASKQKENQVFAPELDVSTAHTLLEFMYTGRYQDLKPAGHIKPSAVSVYETNTCVYCAAVRYQLAGLVALAKEKIMSLHEGVSISDILRIAKEQAFPLLPENETWYSSYLEAAIKRAMAKDPEPFKRPDFITLVEGNSRLLQVVWKTVISNYAGVVSTPTRKDDNVCSTSHEQEKREDDVSQSQPPASVDGSQTTAVANDAPIDPPSPGTPCDTTASAAAPVENSLELDDIDPSFENLHQVPEPFTDELGFQKSTTFQKMNKTESVAIESAVVASDSARSAHKRSDSVLQNGHAAAREADDVATESVEKAGAVEGFGGLSPLVADGSVDATTASKKAKKKKRGGKSSTVF